MFSCVGGVHQIGEVQSDLEPLSEAVKEQAAEKVSAVQKTKAELDETTEEVKTLKAELESAKKDAAKDPSKVRVVGDTYDQLEQKLAEVRVQQLVLDKEVKEASVLKERAGEAPVVAIRPELPDATDLVPVSRSKPEFYVQVASLSPEMADAARERMARLREEEFPGSILLYRRHLLVPMAGPFDSKEEGEAAINADGRRPAEKRLFDAGAKVRKLDEFCAEYIPTGEHRACRS